MNPSSSSNDTFNQPVPPAPAERTVRVSLPKSRPVVTFTLIGITVGMYLLQMLSVYLTGGIYDYPYIFGGKINQLILAGQVWRLITPVLLHGSILHIAFNMYALYTFGPQLEKAYGHWRFLGLYLLGGFAGNVFSFAFSSVNSIGSSTAIFGLVAAEAVFIYQNRNLFGARTRSILVNLGVIVVINLAIGLAPGSSIDNWGHLGGILGGAIFAWLAGPKWVIEGFSFETPRITDQRSKNQVGLGILAVLVIFGSIAVARFLIG